jgi:DNA-binding transcriptional MerR regulator
MTTGTEQRGYTIKETAALTGLPASTLRYYEQIGVIPPIGRDASSGHRVYDEADLDQLVSVACLAATGLSVTDMKAYVANNRIGAAAAGDQRALLEAQEQRLAQEAEHLVLRQQYVRLKIDYWNAVEAGDDALVQQITTLAHALANELQQTKHH